MATTLNDRVQRYFYTTFGSDHQVSTTQLSEILTSACRMILSNMPFNRILNLLEKSSDIVNDSGVSLAKKRLESAIRDGIRARLVPISLSSEILNSDSLHYADEDSPASYIDSNTLYIKPAPTATKNGHIFYVSYPDLLFSMTEETAEVAKLSGALLDLVIMYAVVDVLGREKNYYREITKNELTSVSTAFASFLTEIADEPAKPTAPLFDTMTTLPTLSLSTMSALPAPPVAEINTTLSEGSYSKSVELDGVTTYTLEHNLGYKPSCYFVDSSGVEYDASSYHIEHTDDNELVVTFGESFTGTLYYSVGSLNDLTLEDITLTLPTAPTIPTLVTDLGFLGELELPALALSEAPATVPLEDLSFEGELDLTTITITLPASCSVEGISKVLPTETEDYLIAMTEVLPTFIPPTISSTPPTTSSISFDDFDTAYAAEDLEKAQTELQKQIALIQIFQADISNEAQRVKSDVDNYQSELQRLLSDIQEQINVYNADVNTVLADYNADINNYQAVASSKIGEYREKINAAVQQYLDEWKVAAETYQSVNSAKIQKLSADVQIYSAESGALISEYSAKAQALISEFQSNFDVAVKTMGIENEAEVQQFNIELQKYAQQVSAVIAEYSAKVNKITQYYKLQSDREISIFAQETSAKISYYQSQIQQYNAEVNQVITEYQALTGVEIAEYNALVQAYISEYSTKAQVILGQYSTDINSYLGELQTNVARAGSYLSEIASHLQTAVFYMNRANSAREVYNEQYNIFKREYYEYAGVNIDSKKS